ncbi:MAG: inner membrane protein YhjD [Mycobacteriaceae bacterium]|nr:inner membrane protein YhjD [Mycobacteriaceae bacterium]
MDRLRARYRWFDHAMRAQERYRNHNGDFYAAGITYFTVFALFPLLMVGFAIAGVVLLRQPDVLAQIHDAIKRTVSGGYGQQIVELMDRAIRSWTSVGIIGLAAALWAGLGWMANLRKALSAMWGQQQSGAGFVRTKASDLVALLSAFLAIVLTVALTTLSSGGLMKKILEWLGLQHAPGVGLLLQVVSVVASLLISWLLFTWMIARLPRESLSFRSSVRAGLLAAVAFEVFKQVATVYLRAIMRGPAGATFGSILGLLVFAYITARLILFATAWAATATENVVLAPAPPPGAAIIAPRSLATAGIGVQGALVAGAVGALGALGVSRVLRRRQR